MESLPPSLEQGSNDAKETPLWSVDRDDRQPRGRKPVFQPFERAGQRQEIGTGPEESGRRFVRRFKAGTGRQEGQRPSGDPAADEHGPVPGGRAIAAAEERTARIPGPDRRQPGGGPAEARFVPGL